MTASHETNAEGKREKKLLAQIGQSSLTCQRKGEIKSLGGRKVGDTGRATKALQPSATRCEAVGSGVRVD